MAELIAQGGPELARAVEREFRTGWAMQREMAERRERARSGVPHARSGGVEGLGRVTSAISADSYFYWLNEGRRRHGVENIWTEEEFRRDYLRDHPQARVGYQALNPVSGWTPGAAEVGNAGEPEGAGKPEARSTGAGNAGKPEARPTIVAGRKYGMGVGA